jgi:hypothetical protein
MKTNFAVSAAILATLLMLPVIGDEQTPPKTSTFTIAGQTGEAQLLQLNGKSYIEIQTLARLTKGTLSFKADKTTLTTILTLPPAEMVVPVSAPPSASAAPSVSEPSKKLDFSSSFVQASIEELSVIREWRVAIVSAVQNNAPAAEDWIAAQHRLANKNLSLATAAATTDDDRSATPLLTSELNNMQQLSDRYLALRKQFAFISLGTFDSTPLEQQILSCAQGFVSMTESHSFQDLPACH